MQPNAWLIRTLADGEKEFLEITKERAIIGRQAPADLILDSPRISRRHALLQSDGFGFMLSDLGSRNGTFVNGEQLDVAPQRLHSGDEIVLGGVMVFHFDEPSATEPGPRLGRLKGVWIDPGTDVVWIDGKRVIPPLSAAQFTLLSLLYHAQGRPVPREEIIATVWPDADPSGVTADTVKSLINRLRKRLRDTQNDYIEVLRERGVRLVHPE